MSDSAKKTAIGVGGGGVLALLLKLCAQSNSEVGVAAKTLRVGEEAVAIGKGGVALSKGGGAGGVVRGMARTRPVPGKGLVTHGLDLFPDLVDLADSAKNLDATWWDVGGAGTMADAGLLDSENTGPSSGTLLEWAIRHAASEVDKAIKADGIRFSGAEPDAGTAASRDRGDSGKEDSAHAPTVAVRVFAPWHLRERSLFDGKLPTAKADSSIEARAAFPWSPGPWQHTYTGWIPVAQSWYATRSNSGFKVPVLNEPGIVSLVPESPVEFERMFGRRPSDAETVAMDDHRRMAAERPLRPLRVETEPEVPLARLDRAITRSESRYYVILGWSREGESHVSTSDGGKVRAGDIHAACLAANRGCWVIRRALSTDADTATAPDPGLAMVRAGLAAIEKHRVWDFTHAMLEAQAAVSPPSETESAPVVGCRGDAGKTGTPSRGCEALRSRPSPSATTLSTMFTSGRGRPTGRPFKDDPPEVFLLVSKPGAAARREAPR